MPIRLAALLSCLLLGVLACSSARAATAVPGRTDGFVAFCATQFKACRSEIVTEQIAVLASKAWAKSPSDACAVPDGIDDTAAAHEIIAWLQQHPETGTMKTGDGIDAAVRGIWNCRDKVETGHTSLGAPDRTGEFVKFCGIAANYAKCANEMVSADLAVTMRNSSDGASAHCGAPDDMDTKPMAKAIYLWLRAHSETYEMETEKGVEAAIDALWPCH